MNRFLSTIVVTVAAIAISVPVLAQDAGPRGGKGGAGAGQPGQPRMGMRMGRMNDEMMKKLNLTAEQKKKVEALQKKQQAERRKVMEGMKLTPGTQPTEEQRKQMREKMQPMIERHQKEFQEILTPTQREQFKKMIEEARKRFTERRTDK